MKTFEDKALSERTTAQTSTSTANDEHAATKGENDREGAADAGRQQRVTRDAEAAVALLEEKAKDGNGKKMRTVLSSCTSAHQSKETQHQCC